MKNTFDRLTSRLDTAEEQISELEDTSVETYKTKKQMKQRLKKKIQNRIFKDCEATMKGLMYA